MAKYRQFIFESYDFDRSTGLLQLHYAMDDALHFTEKFSFDFDYIEYDEAAFDRAVQLLFFLAGVSYYKTYFPPEIIVKQGRIDASLAAFLNETYQKGLGEFFYINNLDPLLPIGFPVNSEELTPLDVTTPTEGSLIAVGGGKDSLVSIELLRDAPGIMTWSLNHRAQLAPLVERIGLPHAWVGREWDKQIAELNAQDAYNGHVPISSIFAATSVIVCVLTGRKDAVFSNEQSANEPTLTYQGVDINHQYSKSQAWERLFQEQLGRTFGGSIRYYSFLRPLSEVMIAKLFSQYAYQKYKDVFSSCNRAFVHASDRMFWCGECSKCAFIFLALTPFIPRHELEQVWHGKNLLLDENLRPTYRKLLGIEGDKPLDCVGEIKEVRAAMRIAEQIYPELKGLYQYELPDDYDYAALASHEMPAEVYNKLITAIG